RITIRGYNTPAIKAYPQELQFGMCPPGDGRIMLFTVINLLPVDCPIVMLVLPSTTSAQFQITPTQTVLTPKEKKNFQIKFAATVVGEAMDELILVAFGGEITRIDLKGVCGEALHLVDSKLDFGPTDIFFNSAVKRIMLTNRSNIPLPVSFECSTNEIIVNRNKPVILDAGEKRRIPIEFLSTITGPREEFLTVGAPHSNPVTLEALAFSGPAIWVPVMENVVFSTAFTMYPSTARIPMVNLTDNVVQCLVTVPSGSPFSIRLLDAETANRRVAGSTAISEAKVYEGPDSTGIMLTLGSRLTAIIEIVFLSSAWGSFRTPLTIQMVKPRKWPVAALQLNAVAVNGLYLQREKPTELLRRFISGPSNEPPTGLVTKKSPERQSQSTQPLEKTSEIFELDPPLQTVFGAFLSTRQQDVCEFVTLTNTTSTTQRYHIALSEHFYTDIPLDGELDGLASIEISVRLDTDYFDEMATVETRNFVIIGAITVFDEEPTNPGMVTAALHGLLGNLVSIECREGCDTIKYPPSKVMEKHTKKFFLRNRAPFEVVWEGRMISIGQQGIGLQSDGLPMIVPTGATATEWCPFSLSVPRISLKPFEFYTLDITFQATSSGEYGAKFFMEYVDPVTHIVNSDHVKGRVKRSLGQMLFRCSVGTADLTADQEYLDHGDVMIGVETSRAMTVVNSQPLDTAYSVIVPHPFRVMDILGRVGRQSRIGVPILFAPASSKAYSNLITLFFNGTTKVLPVLATGGLSIFVANLAVPRRIELNTTGSASDKDIASLTPAPQHTIDFGFVELGHPKGRTLVLSNMGTFDFIVKNIVVNDENVLSWKFLEEAVGENNSLITRENWTGFGSESLDDVEIDWDESDFRAREGTSGSGNASFDRKSGMSMTAAPRRRRYKSISHGFAAASATSKWFPFRLPPYQTCGVQLSVAGFAKGHKAATLKVELERANGEEEHYMFWVHGNVQPPLQLWEKKIEFGVRAVHLRHKAEIRFTNTGSEALPWTLVNSSTKYVPIKKFDPPYVPTNESAIPPPISFFPTSGKLLPGCTQVVDIAFTPSLAQYEVFSYFNLQTADFANAPIIIHGVGASSRLAIDCSSLAFGVLRVGTQKAFKIKMTNKGILAVKYFVECSNPQFSADPEQGLLEGDGLMDITVKFAPKSVGKYESVLRIVPQSAVGHTLNAISVPLSGVGSYPELVVLTRTVDFGTALFMTANLQPVRVQNKGAADAHIVFSCHHAGIKLDGDREELVIPPHCTKDINIVYTPQVVESLNVKAYLRSSDSRGDHFMLSLKGHVGVPKLVFTPEDIFSSLDFGVCAVNGIYKKTFMMKNEGNIRLTYEIQLENMTRTLSDIPGHFESGTKVSTPKQGIIHVQPTSGSLAVGDCVEATITFIPDALAEYECHLTLNYEFRNITSVIKGTGGRAVLQVDNPLKLIDFGVCRLNRVFRKPLTIKNNGNLGVIYHLRPEPVDGDWDVYAEEFKDDEKKGAAARASVTELDPLEQQQQPKKEALAEPTTTVEPAEPRWVALLRSLGFHLLNADGYCPPHQKIDLQIEYNPKIETPVEVRLRVVFSDQHEDIDVCARGASPRLTLYGPAHELLGVPGEVRTLDLGVHPIHSEHVHALQLKNDGPFGVDFLIQPMGIREFEVQPLRGYILPGASKPLRVVFRPSSETKIITAMKILWEQAPLRVQLIARGGSGKLDIVYAEDKENQGGGLDFGMVPFNSSAEKRFWLFNTGMVEISLQADVDNDEFAISLIGEPVEYDPATRGKRQTPTTSSTSKQRTVWNWLSTLRTVLAPGMGVEVVARFIARAPTLSAGNIEIRSEGGTFLVPTRGKGGTIQISHRGDLNMGDIATNHTYTRKITIINSGSIPSGVTAEWLVVGHNTGEAPGSYARLVENYSAFDPRSGWARQQFLKERGITGTGEEASLTAKDRWKLIQMMIRKAEAVEEEENDPLSKAWGSTLGKLRGLLANQRQGGMGGGGESVSRVALAQNESVPTTATSMGTGNAATMSRTSLVGTASQTTVKKSIPAHFSAQFKRRQMFFHLITNVQLSSQSLPTTKPYLKVEPATAILPSYGEFTLNVEVNLGTEDTVLATLLIKPNVPNTPIHEIPLTATPKAVYILCDDTRMLNFHRQPLGESETLTRTFTNVGHKDFNYRIINPNSSLIVSPHRGTLKVGQTVTIKFIFRPTDETLQTSDIIFEPDISQPIRLKMYGGGGYTKASLSRYRRFDFGHCMIGKDTVSFLPITNEGSAMLHLTRFELHETDTFFKGLEWPSARVSLFPGKTYNLPIVFNPHEETPAPGRLVVGTNTEAWEIELIGLGREAVLIVSKVALEFSECLIGNSYEQKLGLKNVGDVNYPVTFKLEKEFPDIEFIPPSLVVNPFSESDVIIAFTPGRETKQTVVLLVSSPYSTHKVPLLLHAGTAIVEFSPETLNFGLFERTTTPSLTLTLKNTGTVRTSFTVRDAVKPSMFSITQGRGILSPGRSAEVIITHTKHVVEQISEQLIIRTDLIDKVYTVPVRGQCEEALLRPPEFNFLNMGTCPVLETTSKPVSFTNYGRFPLEYTLKSSYPLKIATNSTGVIAGGETATVLVTWNPSGGYELRTHISLSTNIGNFIIIVRGKASFPELGIKNTYLDFGVCAIGHTYKETFTLVNKGKVPFTFSIPAIREQSYSVNLTGGRLEPKETKDVCVSFKPASLGRYAHTLSVECKGINNKEVVLVGIGGILKLDIQPSVLEIGKCPCSLKVYHSMVVTNKGEVTVHVGFTIETTKGCVVTTPDGMVLKPNRAQRVFFGVTALEVGEITAKVTVTTKERAYGININGTGMKITLSPLAESILSEERLPFLTPVIFESPFTQELGDVDDWIRNISLSRTLDILIREWVTWLYLIAREAQEKARVETTVKGSLEQRDEEGPQVEEEGGDREMMRTDIQKRHERFWERVLEIKGMKEVMESTLTSVSMPQGQQQASPEGEDTPEVLLTSRPSTSDAIPPSLQSRVSLLNALHTLPLPSAITDLDNIMSRFLELRSPHASLTSAHVDQDPIIDQIINYPYPFITQPPLLPLLLPLAPSVEISLSSLLDRPPPFAEDTASPDTTPHGDEAQPKKKERQWIQLERGRRNARTVDSFRNTKYLCLEKE
ncbi:hypothetical protein BC832DRAFT_557874, partial [Gaertneriomyces semiglobifer]